VYWIRTGRLVLAPYIPSDLPDLQAFKADPRCWAGMLGGICTPERTASEFADELRYWGAHDVGMWTARDLNGRLLGVTGLHERHDARGVALRFAFDPACRGQGLAREAAGAVLQDAHYRAGLTRVIAVARDDNIASRTVLGAIGMRDESTFEQGGVLKHLYASERNLR
jgi:RimJ/RimL family protein N-acetyltransferase